MDGMSSIIVKLASRCNLKCDYCYMFEHADKSYLTKPKVMPFDVFQKLIYQIKEGARQHGWSKVKLTLHGGEPLLAGKEYFKRALAFAKSEFSDIEKFNIGLQTNGVLIDQEWLNIFEEFQIGIGISLDGPAWVNDLHRNTHGGSSSHEKVVEAIRMCQSSDKVQFGGVIAVIDPRANGKEVFNYFADELNLQWMDFLLPDANHDDSCDYHKHPALSYARFLGEVFDTWWARGDSSIHVRALESIVDLLIGGDSATDSLGLGVGNYMVVESDGSMEPLDVLRIIQNGYTRQDLYVGDVPLSEFFSSPLLKKLKAAGETLPTACQPCTYKKICGGGYLPHRYSATRGFDNPSLYCNDLKAIISHVWSHIGRQVRQSAL